MRTNLGISINGSDVRQSLSMTSAGSSSSFSAFAAADAGFEYLVTAEHYQYLARSIVDALRRHCLVLVTGDPPASPGMLAAALREAAAPRAVIELSCGPGLDCENLFGGGSMPSEAPAPVTIGEDPGAAVPPSPILVFTNADRLSDGQIAEFREAARTVPSGPHGLEAGVLVAHSDFVARARSAELHLLDPGLAEHLRVQQLDRDEVEAFIRHQLPPGEGANLFTAQRVALIAITSGGDPAVVNRVARRMLEVEPDASAPPRVTPRRYAVLLRLPAGIIICLAAAWLAAGAFEHPDLDAFIGLVRDHIMPRNELSEAPAGAAAMPSAVNAKGSVNVAAAPPSAAAAGETMSEPVTTSGADPAATSLPSRTPGPALRPGSDGPRLSAAEMAGLVARGDAFLDTGDIASARLFFERAADAGDGRAAMRMAVTYDTAFLDRAGLHGLDGDPERATFWYRRARELGEGKAEPPLGSPGVEPPRQPRR